VTVGVGVGVVVSLCYIIRFSGFYSTLDTIILYKNIGAGCGSMHYVVHGICL